MPREMVLKIGGVWASVVGGIFKQPSEFHGRLEYAIVKNEKLTPIGMVCKKGHVIFIRERKTCKNSLRRLKPTWFRTSISRRDSSCNSPLVWSAPNIPEAVY